jgi:TfoX/Sxy family transcriptional regulator of competence genes
MKMEKSPPELERLFDSVFPADPRAERRKMFGYAAGFVNGNHFGGLFASEVVVRLGEADLQLITAEHDAAPFMPMGKAMTGYVIIPPAIVDEPERLREWLQCAFEYGASLPPKEKKPPKAQESKAKKTSR